MERIAATYFIETPIQPEKAAAILAGEQSSGTFVPVPGETPRLKEQFAARVESVEVVNIADQPAIPGGKIAGRYTQAMIKVSWPVENFGYNLPVLISTIQGNLYELRQFTGLKLIEIDLPNNYVNHFRGPKFGAGNYLRYLAGGPATNCRDGQFFCGCFFGWCIISSRIAKVLWSIMRQDIFWVTAWAVPQAWINSSRAIAFEVGLQNGGMASGLAGSMGKLGTVGLPAAVFSPWMNISGSLLANYWRRRPVKEKKTGDKTVFHQGKRTLDKGFEN